MLIKSLVFQSLQSMLVGVLKGFGMIALASLVV